MTLLDYVKEYHNKFYIIDNNRPPFEQFYNNMTSCRESQMTMVEYLRREGLLQKKSCILILGCGAGQLERVLIPLEQKVRIVGVDLSRTGVTIARMLQKEDGLERLSYANCVGESLPFKDGSFDAVVSNQVLEHVADLEMVFAEIFRVLKRGGYTYHFCPNYRSFYEGHYDMFWLPLRFKPLLKLYVRLRGYPADVIDNLNLLTFRQLKRIMLKTGFWCVTKDIFKQSICRKLDGIIPIQNKKIESIVSWLNRLHIKSLLKVIVRVYPFFHIFHIKAKKG